MTPRPREDLARVAAHRFGRGEATAAGEDAKACEQLLLGRLEQLVAPVDRGPNRALSLGQIDARRRRARAGGSSSSEAARAPAARRIRAAASSSASGSPSSRGRSRCSPRRGEGPDRQPARGRRRAAPRRSLQRRRAGTRAAGSGQRAERELVLGADTQMESGSLPAAGFVRRRQETGERLRCVLDLLEVVEDEQRAPAVEVRPHCLRRVSPRLDRQGERLGDLGGDETSVLDRREVDEVDAVAIPLQASERGLEREPGLSGTSRPREREQSHVFAIEPAFEPLDLTDPADQGRRRQRKLRERGEGRASSRTDPDSGSRVAALAARRSARGPSSSRSRRSPWW